MKIGIDLDGCAYDFGASFKDYLIEIGLPGAADLTSTRWEIWLDWGMELDEWLRYFKNGVAAGRIFRTGAPEAGFQAAMNYFRAAGHTLHIVTYRDIHPRAIQSTCEWLAEHKIPYDTITFAKDKTVVPVDVFIEDNPENAIALALADTGVALMDRTWNRVVGSSHRAIRRVYSWREFALAIDRMTPMAA